jgi:hypothetical protein
MIQVQRHRFSPGGHKISCDALYVRNAADRDARRVRGYKWTMRSSSLSVRPRFFSPAQDLIGCICDRISRSAKAVSTSTRSCKSSRPWLGCAQKDCCRAVCLCSRSVCMCYSQTCTACIRKFLLVQTVPRCRWTDMIRQVQAQLLL